MESGMECNYNLHVKEGSDIKALRLESTPSRPDRVELVIGSLMDSVRAVLYLPSIAKAHELRCELARVLDVDELQEEGADRAKYTITGEEGEMTLAQVEESLLDTLTSDAENNLDMRVLNEDGNRVEWEIVVRLLDGQRG